MSYNDFLIPLRERFLDTFSGSDRTEILNSHSASNTELIDGDPAAELVDLLHEVLSSGLTDHGENVDYAALRANTLYQHFRRCTAKLRAFDPSTLPNQNARLAFWINLYNTLVLDGVIALGITRSVMERRAGIIFFRQAAYVVGGQRLSCDDIEHGILRANRGHPFYPGKQFQSSDPRLNWVVKPSDVRVHFVLNCARRFVRIHARTWLHNWTLRRVVISQPMWRFCRKKTRFIFRLYSNGLQQISAGA
jgi:hypothetical protein